MTGGLALTGLVTLLAHPATRSSTCEAFVEAYEDAVSLTESNFSRSGPDYKANLKKMGELDYQPSIRDQIPEASPELAEVVACMVDELPNGVGQVSSITTSKSSFDGCVDNWSKKKCVHGADSGHFGFRDHYPEGSLAIDFGDEWHACEIARAAEACDANRTLGPGVYVGKCDTRDPSFYGKEKNSHFPPVRF